MIVLQASPDTVSAIRRPNPAMSQRTEDSAGPDLGAILDVVEADDLEILTRPRGPARRSPVSRPKRHKIVEAEDRIDVRVISRQSARGLAPEGAAGATGQVQAASSRAAASTDR